MDDDPNDWRAYAAGVLAGLLLGLAIGAVLMLLLWGER